MDQKPENNRIDRGCDMHIKELNEYNKSKVKSCVMVIHSDSEQVIRKREDIPQVF